MPQLNIKPIGERIIVQHIQAADMSGGIFIPEGAKEKPQEAIILALGAGRRNETGQITPFEVKVGDKVLVSKYGGTEVKIENQKYVIITEDEILGVIGN